MRNNIKIKYAVFSALVLSFLLFLFFLLGSYINFVTDQPLLTRLVIFYLLSLVTAFLITWGFSIFTRTFSDTMMTIGRLLGIESLSNPLLLRMSEEASGTYHHSLNVSAIAGKATAAIGGNALLVRTAAYYHDLGKLSNPKVFIENQSEEEIPGDINEMSIKKMAEDIISHVGSGVKIAKDNDLPDEVVDLISEHHGTMRVTYFYEMAKLNKLKVKKTDFRYKGPKPQSKESIVLMLADCVEAAARAEDRLTKETVREIVNNTVNERINEKQILPSIMNESELKKVKLSLINSLISIYHRRINYKNS